VRSTHALGKLAEIAENLHRREIDALERDELRAAWVKLRSERGPLVAQLAPLKEPGKGRGSEGGVRKTARDLEMQRDAVSRSLKVAALSPEAKAKARVTGLALKNYTLDGGRNAMRLSHRAF
jgi:hypothetical protein